MPRWWRRGRRFENEMNEELAFHIEERERELIEDGVPAEVARYRARAAFGNVTRVKEEGRQMRIVTWLEDLWKDVRYGLRSMRRAPVLTAVAVASLALGIGGNTAIFSILNAILWKNLPVANPEQLSVAFWETRAWPQAYVDMGLGNMDEKNGVSRSWSFPYPVVEAWKSASPAVAGVAAFQGLQNASVVHRGQAQQASGAFVDRDFFPTLGVQAFRGRLIAAEDDRADATPVAVLSHRFWVEQFGADESLLGATLRINNTPVTVIGIAHPAFFGLDRAFWPELYVPMRMQGQIEPRWAAGGQDLFSNRRAWWVQAVIRRKAGASEQEFRAALERAFVQSVPPPDQPVDPKAVPQLRLAAGAQGYQFLQDRSGQTLKILMAAVGVVLLIACANIANLLLARAMTRRKETAVRLALGASRARLIRQSLAESLSLSILGGVLGWMAAIPGVPLLLRLASSDTDPRRLDAEPDWIVLLFTAGITIATGIFFGLLPAWQSYKVNLDATMREHVRALASGWAGRWSPGRLLVIAQMALSVVLLAGAGLCVQTLLKLKSTPMGFNGRNVLLFSTDAETTGYRGAKLHALHNQVVDRLRALPGVESASYSSLVLLSESAWISNLRLPSEPKPKSFDPKKAINLIYVGPDFHRTMQIPLVEGRSIEPQDRADRPGVLVLNEAAAKRYFPNGGAVGSTLLGDESQAYTVVGICADTLYAQIREKDGYPPIAYMALPQAKQGPAGHFEVRTQGDPLMLATAIRDVVRQVDPNLSVFDLRTQDAQIARSLQEDRVFAWLSTALGLLAVMLCAIGLYGLVAYSVSRRTTEIGVRLTLGADGKEVVRLILRETLWLLVPGLALGLAIAMAATRAIESLLYQLSPQDPLAMGGAVGVMLVIGLFAAWLPARRAARLDPMTALRHE